MVTSKNANSFFFLQRTKSVFYDDMGSTGQVLLPHSKDQIPKENNLHELNYPLLHGIQTLLEKVNDTGRFI